MMGLLSYSILATNNGNCRCYNCSRPRKLFTSYFMYAVAVFVVLLFSVDFSFAVQQSEQLTHPKLIISSNAPIVPPAATKQDAASTDMPRELKVPVDFLDDIKKDGGSDNVLPESKGLFVGEDTNGVPIVVGTWFRYGSYTLAFTMFGTAFLVSCVASAIYYVLFVVTEPSQQQKRSMEGEEGWNVGRILRALQLAYETYETFDLYSPACQLKTLCEIQESGHFRGSLVKRLAHFIIHTDLVQKKMANAADLQAADRIGNDPEETCSEKFSECRFSVDKLYQSYITM